ncbi:hypothetical protein [Desulfotruncus arcticus]|uniref:hypothetical protein n=1 Tax=Desulfotruncus arcticus TaxID=341036 RepID=UPI0010420CDA|nr:hypothetical protein [Desulfotruncus arcticus]
MERSDHYTSRGLYFSLPYGGIAHSFFHIQSSRKAPADDSRPLLPAFQHRAEQVGVEHET